MVLGAERENMNDLRVACKKADEGVNRAGDDINSGICSLPASEK